ncbi:MAG: hypothetical protein KKE73_01710 [Proteobacteria bacterium]|nr:hypothetical protein [Pseudomonadota bacterium]
MGKTRNGLVLVILCVLCVSGLALFSAPIADGAEAVANDGAALVMNSCTLCHDTQRVCKALGNKGKDGWDITVTKMIFKGAPVDHEQKQVIVDWLWNLPAGSPPVCPKEK